MTTGSGLVSMALLCLGLISALLLGDNISIESTDKARVAKGWKQLSTEKNTFKLLQATKRFLTNIYGYTKYNISKTQSSDHFRLAVIRQNVIINH